MYIVAVSVSVCTVVCIAVLQSVIFRLSSFTTAASQQKKSKIDKHWKVDMKSGTSHLLLPWLMLRLVYRYISCLQLPVYLKTHTSHLTLLLFPLTVDCPPNFLIICWSTITNHAHLSQMLTQYILLCVSMLSDMTCIVGHPRAFFRGDDLGCYIRLRQH